MMSRKKTDGLILSGGDREIMARFGSKVDKSGPKRPRSYFIFAPYGKRIHGVYIMTRNSLSHDISCSKKSILKVVFDSHRHPTRSPVSDL